MNDNVMTGAPCCGPTPDRPVSMNAEAARDAVRAGYAAIARGASAEEASSSCGALPTVAEPGAGGCCGPSTLTAADVALAVGYSPADLASLPQGANMGLSCGNPTALASLRDGEVVLDLGAGSGFDCFVAGPRVGASGRVIGVDMTPEMLSRARANVAHYRRATGLDNVEFRLGEIEHLPVADASVNVVVSNCVLNLSPDKASAWREIARVLRPGGRVAVSDIALRRVLPDGVRADVEALIGCIAGAVLVDELRALALAAGLEGVEVREKPEYVAAFEDAGDPLYLRILQALPPGSKVSDFVTSVDVTACKAAKQGCC